MMARAQAKRNADTATDQSPATGSADEASGNTLGSVGRLGYSDLPRHRGTGAWFTLRRYIGLLAAIADIASYGRAFVLAKRSEYDVILVEESPFDVFAKRHRPFFPLSAKLLKRLIPAPDLLVFCVADTSEIVRRKPELTEAEIENYYTVMDKVYAGVRQLPIHRHDTNPSQDPYSDLDEIILTTIA